MNRVSTTLVQGGQKMWQNDSQVEPNSKSPQAKDEHVMVETPGIRKIPEIMWNPSLWVMSN